MRSLEFVAPYADEMSGDQIHAGSHSQYIEDAQDWSYKFGRFAHSVLRDEVPAEGIGAYVDMASYATWLQHEGMDLQWRGKEGDQSDYLRCYSEANFHALNQHFMPMWMLLSEGSWPSERVRRDAFEHMAKQIGVDGLVRYAIRKKFVSQEGTETLFTERNKPFADVTNGALQEFDAAMVLLDVAKKHPDMAVVPAPLQFERGVDSTRNVDFLIIKRMGKRAIGAQVKSNVHGRTASHYDSSRVVLIDGNVDFDNILSMRTKKGSSHEKVVGWPGLLNAKRVQDLPVRGKGMNSHERVGNMRVQAMARQVLGEIKVDYPRAVSRIEERILDKL